MHHIYRKQKCQYLTSTRIIPNPIPSSAIQSVPPFPEPFVLAIYAAKQHSPSKKQKARIYESSQHLPVLSKLDSYFDPPSTHKNGNPRSSWRSSWLQINVFPATQQRLNRKNLPQKNWEKWRHAPKNWKNWRNSPKKCEKNEKLTQK